MNHLRRLTASDLEELARALRAGRLVPPLTGTALQRYLSSDVATNIAAELAPLFATGLTSDHLLAFVEALAMTRSEALSAATTVDLVTTGPEAPGITNRDTRIVIGELFASAKESVMIAGYAIHRGEQVFQDLAVKMEAEPHLNVRMYLNIPRGQRDTSLASELVHRFAHHFRTVEWPGRRLPEIYYDPRSLEMNWQQRASLHAKCIVIDHESAFVTSANFTTAAQLKNIEVGVLIRAAGFAARLAHHFESLAAAGALSRLPS